MNKSNKNKTVALLLCIFLGYLGVHRFYVGKKKSGILYLFTCGICGIGWIYDIVQLATGKFTDVHGSLLINMSIINNNNYNTHQLHSVHSNPNPSEKKIKTFTLDEAMNVYFCTDHWSCDSTYDFKRYFSDAFECILQNIKQYDIQLSQEKVLRQKEIKNPISETKNITKATNVSKIKDFVVIDTETTGLKCGGNDIIEICAIKFLDFQPTEKFHTYLKPRNPIPADATAINKITDDMVVNAPTFAQVKSSLQGFIGHCPLVAHNAPFDMKFLHVSGLDLSAHTDKVYDTLHLARLKLRNYDGSKYDSYKLSDLCIENNIACTNFHSADSDTLACGILFVDIIKQVKEVTNINELLNK